MRIEERTEDRPEMRELCGVFIRTERDGEWQNICFSDMTEEEMDTFLATKDKPWVDSLAKILAKKLHEIGDTFDITCVEDW